MTTVKNILEFSDDYSRSTTINMFWYEDKTHSVDSYKAKNELESTFTFAVANCGTIAVK